MSETTTTAYVEFQKAMDAALRKLLREDASAWDEFERETAEDGPDDVNFPAEDRYSRWRDEVWTEYKRVTDDARRDLAIARRKVKPVEARRCECGVYDVECPICGSITTSDATCDSCEKLHEKLFIDCDFCGTTYEAHFQLA